MRTWSSPLFFILGKLQFIHPLSEKEMPERVKDADIIVANKLPMCEETLKDAKNLKLVCLTATGINNLDGEYLKKRGIHACNVAGYSTDAVASILLPCFFICGKNFSFYDDYVKSGAYIKIAIFRIFPSVFMNSAEKHGESSEWELLGKRLRTLRKLLAVK